MKTLTGKEALLKSLMRAHLGEYELIEAELKRIAQDKPS